MSFQRTVAFLVAIGLAGELTSCSWHNRNDKGFAVALVESGEVVIDDKGVAAYVLDEHRIVLAPSGIERWESFARFDRSHNPPTRQPSRLTGKEFILSIDGVEIYRGHFWSMVLSQLQSGVLIYDTLGGVSGDLWIRFERLNENLPNDPRNRPEVADHFRKKGKLK